MSAFDGTSGPTIAVQVLDTTVVPAVWTALTPEDVKAVRLRRGRSNPNRTIEAGTMTVLLDNTSGEYDPDNTGSAWYPVFRAAAQVKLVATWDSTAYTLFRGWLETAPVDHSLEPTVQMTFVDAVARMSAIPTTAMPNWLYDTDYDDERIDDRIARLTSSALLSPLIDGTDVDSAARKLTPIRKGANFTQILDECAVAKAARWYITREGALAYKICADKFTRPTRLALADSWATNTVEYDVLKVSPGADILCNDARLNTPGRNSNDEQYWFQKDSSVSAYGIKSNEYSAPVYNSDWASTLAMFYCRQWAEPTSFASRVEFSALALGALYPDLLKCELSDLLSIERTTVDGRTLTWDCVIEGLDHEITPDSWRVGFDTSPVNGFYPDLSSGTPSTTPSDTSPLCPQITITPVPLAITSTTGYTFGTIIDRIRVADSKDVQLEGMLELGAATGTLNLSTRQYQVFSCETNASANFTVNLRGTSSISLAKSLRKGDSVTVTLFVKNGTTAYYCTTVKVDGTTVTPTWTGGTAPGSGTASGWDEYQFTAIKYQDGTIKVRASVAGAK